VVTTGFARQNHLWRAGAAAVVVTATLLATAAPAEAHTVSGTRPTDYNSQILSVLPTVGGLSLRLLDLGNKVQLTNTGADDVTVAGYDGEPYLRVGPKGAFENRRSPAVYLNQTPAPATLPAIADSKAPPDWHKTSSVHTVRWRDRRTRWEGVDPPAVRAAPGGRHVVAQWSIPLRAGETPVVAAGSITWVPGPSAVPWLLLALGLFALTVFSAWLRRWGPDLAAALAVLIAVDAVHSFASAAAAGNSVLATIVRVVGLGFLSTLAWVGGAWAIGRLQRKNELGLLVGALAGFVIGLYSLGDTTILGRSQVAYVFPAVAARAAVALSLGLGFGLVVAVVFVFKRNPGLVTISTEA
jgi:hypothetical protein